jgi:hypothetical protein
MADKTHAGGKKGKRPDLRPARARYWQRGQLRKHKVRNLVRCCGLSVAAATRRWEETRKTRKKSSLDTAG